VINEEINDQSFSVAARVSELALGELRKIIEKLTEKIKQDMNGITQTIKEPELKQGKQTYSQLKRHRDGLTPLELTDPNLRFLNQEMKRAKIDFAVCKDGKGKYILFFKGKDADEMTRAFKKYTQKVVTHANGKPSLNKTLAAAKAAAKALESGREKVKDREMGARGR